MISINATGNCNFWYISGLAWQLNNPKQVLRDVVTQPTGWNESRLPKYRQPNCGIYLFAQGSEDPPHLRPYGPQFKQLVEDLQLGTVTEVPAENPLHARKTGILYVWVIDQAKLHLWFQENVLKPAQEEYARQQESQKASVRSS